MSDTIETKYKTQPYNLPIIEKFLSTVFHSPWQPDENILTWANPSIPKYPISESALQAKLTGRDKALPLYFGTSTCSTDPDSGKLRNRKDLFKRLHVVVLDDIGTKVPFEKLEGIPPTYIIESSEGNYQYGYVLKDPINDLAAATALIHLIYGAGFSDEGGKMPTKLVRLPDGLNGKKGLKGRFKVKLTKLEPEQLWTPEELLRTMKIPTTWDAILKDAELAVARANPRIVGTSLWSPIKAEHQSMSGLVDPVLEWLYGEKLVQQDTGEWVTVKCPWSDEHTSGTGTAGYKPLGRGKTPEARAFHCFHDACSGRHTNEYLTEVSRQGAPEVPAFDPAAALVAKWVFDSSGNCAWDVTSTRHGRAVEMAAFGNLYPVKRGILTAEGKTVRVAESSLWKTSPNRVTVEGVVSDPSDPSRLVMQEGRLYFNAFTRPPYGVGDYEQEDVERFKKYIAYLIPCEESRRYFMSWVAAKIQDPTFRGAAIVMVTETQGVGRSTLGDMIATLLGEWNRANVKFDALLGDSSNFNEWAERLLVVTDETKSVSPNSPSFFKAYESLKDIVDPRTKATELNPKYGKKRIINVCASFLMFSNHLNAICSVDGDRRLYVIENPTNRRTAKFFTAHNAWLAEKDETGLPRWAKSVHRWLLTQKPDMELLTAPPSMNRAKKRMLDASKSGLDVLVDSTISGIDSPFARIQDLVELALSYAHRVGDYNDEKLKAVLRRLFKERTARFNTRKMCKHNETNTNRAPVLIKSLASEDDWEDFVVDKPADEDLEIAFSSIRGYLDRRVAVSANIDDALSAADY